MNKNITHKHTMDNKKLEKCNEDKNKMKKNLHIQTKQKKGKGLKP